MLRKFIVAKNEGKPVVELWGTGLINVGVGEDVSILELANLIAKITGYQGEIKFDHSKPDGTPRKLMDVAKLNALGWKAGISLEEGITKVYHELTERKAFMD